MQCAIWQMCKRCRLLLGGALQVLDRVSAVTQQRVTVLWERAKAGQIRLFF